MKKRNTIVAVSAAFLLSVAFARPCPVYAADGWQQNDTGGWLTVGNGTFYFGTGGNAPRSGLFNLKEETGEVDENGEAVTMSMA